MANEESKILYNIFCGEETVAYPRNEKKVSAGENRLKAK
jgi:hypothetical protein